MKSTSGFSLSKLSLAILLGVVVPTSWAFAAGSTYTWNGGTSSDYNTAANWTSSTGNVPGNVTGDTEQFNSGAANLSITLAAAAPNDGVQMNVLAGQTGSVTINSIGASNFNIRTSGISIASGAGTFTFGATTGTLNPFTVVLGNAVGNFTFTNSSANLATLGTNVTLSPGGSGGLSTMVFNGTGNWAIGAKLASAVNVPTGLTVSGTGNVTLSNANTYTGATLVSSGTLIASNNTSLGFGGSTILNAALGGTTVGTTSAAATLDLTGATTVNEAITLNGGTNGANLTTAGTTTLSNGVAEVDFTNGGSGYTGSGTSITFNNSGTGGTGVTGTYTLTTGTITNIKLGAAGSGYTTAPVVTATGGSGLIATAVLSSLKLDGVNNNIGGAGTLTILAAVADGTSAGGFTKIGTGTVTLSGSNTYSDGTTVNAGVLTASGTAGLGATTGSLTVNNTNTGAGTDVVVNLSTTAATTVGSLSGSIATPSSGVNTATINNGGTGNTFTVNQTTTGTYSGVIAGSGGFALGSLSTNTLTVTGANTYSGGTTVNAGTLMVNNASGTSGTGTGTVTVNSGGTLAGSGFIKPTLAGGVVVNSGTLTPGGVQPTVPFTGTAGTTANGNLTLDTTGLTSGTTILNVTSANLTFALGAGNATSGSQIAVTGPGGIAVNNTIAFSQSSPSTVTINDLVGANLTLNMEYVLIDGNNTIYTGLTLGPTTALGQEITGGLTLLPSNTSGNFFSQWYNSSQLYLVGDNIEVEVVPEPGTWALMLAGLVGLVAWQRRKSQKS